MLCLGGLRKAMKVVGVPECIVLAKRALYLYSNELCSSSYFPVKQSKILKSWDLNFF